MGLHKKGSWPNLNEGICAALAVGALMFGTASRALADAPLTDYRLHAGDKVDVSVWKETELQKTIVVGPDGKLSFPLAGVINAAGKTVTDLRNDLVIKLKAYIPEPVVTVTLTGTEGNVAYVIGQVNKPGAFVMNPNINVLQALSLANGGTPYAKLDGIIIVRSTPQGQRVLQFRYGQVSQGKNLEQNIQLESGDVVVVP